MGKNINGLNLIYADITDNAKVRKSIIEHCLTFDNVYEDYPFRDNSWTVMRHKGNNKVFAWIFEREEHIWVNVKCDPEWRDLWRGAFESVLPAYHLNKKHWNSVILDGSIPEEDVKRMISESYDLTAGRRLKS